MKQKINSIIEYIVYIVNCGLVGMGLGTLVCRILGEDEWSWEKWTPNHKVIYGIICTVCLIPITIWMAAGHIAIRDTYDDEFDWDNDK